MEIAHRTFVSRQGVAVSWRQRALDLDFFGAGLDDVAEVILDLLVISRNSLRNVPFSDDHIRQLLSVDLLGVLELNYGMPFRSRDPVLRVLLELDIQIRLIVAWA